MLENLAQQPYGQQMYQPYMMPQQSYGQQAYQPYMAQQQPSYWPMAQQQPYALPQQQPAYWQMPQQPAQQQPFTMPAYDPNQGLNGIVNKTLIPGIGQVANFATKFSNGFATVVNEVVSAIPFQGNNTFKTEIAGKQFDSKDLATYLYVGNKSGSLYVPQVGFAEYLNDPNYLTPPPQDLFNLIAGLFRNELNTRRPALYPYAGYGQFV